MQISHMNTMFSYFVIFHVLVARLVFAQNPQVNTTSGVVIGATLDVTHSFYGVRYAEPPTGNLRFMPPVAATYSPTPINASIQQFRRCFEISPPLNCTSVTECNENYSEDCLFLDVNVPSRVDFSAQVLPVLPVMFWIHGGGFQFGSGTERIYDSRWLANKTNTIVVSINYRIGSFGGLVYEEEGVSFDGNQGIKDQQLALRWVYNNIENFGGNKSDITIFGQSAGGHSVIMHMMSPSSRPLYRQAIVQSFGASVNFETKEQAQRKAIFLLNALNCTGDNIQCLRNASPIDLVRVNPQVVAATQEQLLVNRLQPYRPVLDGVEFTQPPLQFFQSTTWDTDKKFIIGTTADESADVRFYPVFNFTSRKGFLEFATEAVGSFYGPPAAERYLELAGPSVNYTDLGAQFVGDFTFLCPSLTLSRLLVSSVGAEKRSVFSYVFDSPLRDELCQGVPLSPASILCFFPVHSVELSYVFHSTPVTGVTWTPDGEELANEVLSYWGNFVNTGMPSFNYSAWPAYADISTIENRTLTWPSLRIAYPQSVLEENHRQSYCDIWNSLGIYVNLTSPTTTVTMTTSGTIPIKNSIVLLLGAFGLQFILHFF